MLLFWKLVIIAKNIQSQDSKTTFKQNITCIFLSARVNLKGTFQNETPVSASLTPDVNLSDISWSQLFFWSEFSHMIGRRSTFQVFWSKKGSHHQNLFCCKKIFSRIWAEFWESLRTIKLCSWLQLFYWTKRIHILTEWDLSTLLYLIEIFKCWWCT